MRGNRFNAGQDARSNPSPGQEGSRVLILNGTVIDPSQNLNKKTDVLIEDGKIGSLEKLSAADRSSADEVIDAQGLWVFPGFVDIHVHFREPGNEGSETLATGSRAAARGGFTSVLVMPNTTPPIDTPEMVRWVSERAKDESLVDIYVCGAITVGRQGQQLTDMMRMRRVGAMAFSDDGDPVSNAFMMRQALEYAQLTGAPVMDHCEDHALSCGGCMNEGKIATLLGLSGIPHSSEDTIVARDLLLAEEFGGRIHICHISSGRSVELVRQFKARGVKVSCETAPHYFSVTDAMVQGYNTYAKMNPPLRESHDQAEIIRGLADGTIDAIATDHAPHHDDCKNLEFPSAAFGIIGLETSWALTYTQLVKTKKLSLDQAVSLLTHRPAGVIGVERGTLKVGSMANVTLVDAAQRWRLEPKHIASKSKNSPFYGWDLESKVMRTLYAGKTIYNA